MGFEKSYDMDALTAKSKAQKLAFGPFAFHATVAMRETGLLDALQEVSGEGKSKETLSEDTSLSEYAVSVMVDFGVDLELVTENDGKYALGPVGFFIINDEMTRVNLNFTRDVCYEALEYLEESLRTGEPAGLQTFGDWETLYEGLDELSDPVKESWEDFDHFYSDRAFDSLLPVVFEDSVDQLLDVGGNTGRWSRRCLEYDADVEVTIMDLPDQLKQARANFEESEYAGRVNYLEADLLREDVQFPGGMDAIWMCQLLDCFAQDEIVSILERAREAMGDHAKLYVVELFPDRQHFETATYSLDAISLYFTCLANGNSRFYTYETMSDLIKEAGLSIEREIDVPSSEHTALRCSL